MTASDHLSPDQFRKYDSVVHTETGRTGVAWSDPYESNAGKQVIKVVWSDTHRGTAPTQVAKLRKAEA